MKIRNVAVAIAVLAGATAAWGQTFAAASILPSAQDVKFEHDGDIQARPGNVVMRDVLLTSCMEWAWGIQESQISGPGWIHEDRYDIVARADTPAPVDQLKVMMQALLKERFGLAFHLEQKELRAYEMTVAKGGSKMKDAPADEKMSREKTAISTIAKAITMGQFADFISQPLRMPVVDHTGLTGRYDFVLNFTAYLPAGEKVMTPDYDNNNGIIIAAIEGELGLKLESRKLSVETYAIDHVTKPTAN
ncbi:MAG TPA: TIGR03435 family protein [Bryobacteraceae bacterium]|nr:TIGR03435 family protein [Bryobacteraceae bacterium]